MGKPSGWPPTFLSGTSGGLFLLTEPADSVTLIVWISSTYERTERMHLGKVSVLAVTSHGICGC